MLEMLQILARITKEPHPSPGQSHISAHLLNSPLYERKYARAYFSEENSKDAIDLQMQIARGAKIALEEQSVSRLLGF